MSFSQAADFTDYTEGIISEICGKLSYYQIII